MLKNTGAKTLMLLRKKKYKKKKQQNYMGARTQELHFNRAVICYSVNYSRSKLIILLWSDFGWGTEQSADKSDRVQRELMTTKTQQNLRKHGL